MWTLCERINIFTLWLVLLLRPTPKTEFQLNYYTVSGSPTTTYPFLADDLLGGQNVIDNDTLFLRELLAGQTIIFRVKVGYLNKGAGQGGDVIVRMFNPNPRNNRILFRKRLVQQNVI